jgi:hypothetical protein
MANTLFQTQEGSNQNRSFLNGKNHTPPETKASKKQAQNSTKDTTPLKRSHTQMTMTKTPPEVENTKFYQLRLDKPQVKLRPLKQQSKSMLLWPRHYCHK